MEQPPHLQYEQNWDASIDLTLRRFVYGSLSGAASALLCFRTPSTRWAAVAFGAGAGVGSAFTESSQRFRGAGVGSVFATEPSSQRVPSVSVPPPSPALVMVPDVSDVHHSSHADAPEPEHVEAPKLERSEEPLLQEAQDA